MSEQPKPTKADFHRERSLFLDAFATLEEALSENKKTSSLDEKTNELIKSLKSVRNDIVHCRLHFLAIDGALNALAVNSLNAKGPARHGRLIAIQDFKALKSQIGQVRSKLG